MNSLSICRATNFPGLHDGSWVWEQAPPALARINFMKIILVNCGFSSCYNCCGNECKISEFVFLVFKVHAEPVWQEAVLRMEVLGLALQLVLVKLPVLWGPDWGSERYLTAQSYSWAVYCIWPGNIQLGKLSEANYLSALMSIAESKWCLDRASWLQRWCFLLCFLITRSIYRQIPVTQVI